MEIFRFKRNCSKSWSCQKLQFEGDSPMLQSNVHNDQWPIIIQKLIPLCCQKLRFQRWCNNIQLFHFPSLHRNPKVTIKSWFPYAAVQYSWWPMANNSKVDSSVLPKLRFWGWCKIPSCSFPIVALQSNIPNANIKHLQIPDYSFCCGCICRNNQVQEKLFKVFLFF